MFDKRQSPITVRARHSVLPSKATQQRTSRRVWRQDLWHREATPIAIRTCGSLNMSHPHHHLLTRSIDFWLARGAVLVIVALQSGMVNDLTIGPRWLAPCLELALLIPLSIVTASTQKRARKATTNSQWTLVGRDHPLSFTRRLHDTLRTAHGGGSGGRSYFKSKNRRP
jgi:hypothetical protein